MISFNRIHSAIRSAAYDRDRLLGVPLTDERKKSIVQSEIFAPLMEDIRMASARARQEPIPALLFSKFHLFVKQGTRAEYQQAYYDRRGRLLALALAAWLLPEEAVLETLEDLIWAICEEQSWALPAHLPWSYEQLVESRVPMAQTVDLFAAETAHALAETLYLLEDRLNPWVVHRVKEELERRVFGPVFSSAYTFRWEWRTSNWASVCAGAVGMAALLLVDDRERLAGMIGRLAGAMACFLEGFGADGCCTEGISYWEYGFGYYVYFAEMLRAYTGGELDLLQEDKIAAIARFPAAVELTSPQSVNFSDSVEQPFLSTGLHSRLYERIQAPLPEMTRAARFHENSTYRFPQMVRNLLWTDPAHFHRPGTTGTYLFADAGWVVDKRRLGGTLFAFAAKGGHNDEPHNHNDLGHFLLHAGGETLLVDLGQGAYTRDYFGEKRYEQLHASSDGHTVPFINGCVQGTGESYKGVIRETDIRERTLTVKLDLTEAYPEGAGLGSFCRTFQWACDPERGEAELTLTDAFVFRASDNRLAETFISLTEPRIEQGCIIWEGRQGKAVMDYEADLLTAKHEVLRNDANPVRTRVIHRIRLYADKVPEQAAFVFRFRCTANWG
ncbi:heparinase II/III family protein [Cohnella hashimotonis]|uniref:Heparinase II/III family protein n=1 Tax=Cohnella hashimotonis TaxID=2826895 RepID=A0ABT6TKI9_9BACL|nr:heparinase II/III family protein [Cohnella hashimotonis]MDI4646347.1 heparinase II/III family protein [Cohnella hashimotonis]